MANTVLHSHVDQDGILHCAVPLGSAFANRDVVTLNVAIDPSATPKAWREFIEATAGKWQDEIERLPQDRPEEREAF